MDCKSLYRYRKKGKEEEKQGAKCGEEQLLPPDNIILLKVGRESERPKAN